MKREVLEKFKNLFEMQFELIQNKSRVVRDDFSVCPDDRYDEVDQATTDIEQSMQMRLRNRETLYVKKIKDALKRIEEGTFGECDDCGDDIEIRRLEARPTATLCVGCKEEQERREILTAAGREHKSLGATFSRRFA